MARELGADCCVTVGGGSTTGLGKAIALTSPMPILAVPTTYAGSEMTPIYGITEGGAKKTGRDLRVLPKAVIYDPELTLSLPPALSASSGMNAIAHSVEALYAQDANPVISLMAEEGIRALAKALPSIVKNPKDLNARSKPCTAPGSAASRSARPAWRCTTSSATCSAAASTCRTPRRTRSCCRTRCATTTTARARRWRGSSAPWVCRLRRRGLRPRKNLGLPMRLAELGLKENDLERAARIATEAPYPNPRKVEYAPVLELLRNAYAGHRPS